MPSCADSHSPAIIYYTDICVHINCISLSLPQQRNWRSRIFLTHLHSTSTVRETPMIQKNSNFKALKESTSIEASYISATASLGGKTWEKRTIAVNIIISLPLHFCWLLSPVESPAQQSVGRKTHAYCPHQLPMNYARYFFERGTFYLAHIFLA